MHRIAVLLGVLTGSMACAQDHWLDKFSSYSADQLTDVVTDADGNAYVIGDFSQGMTIHREGLEIGTLVSAGGRDILVAKLDGTGSLLWAVRAGGSTLDVGLKLALGIDGLAVTGLFTGTADLFGTTFSAQGGSTDLFVAKLDPATGDAIWVRTAGGAEHTDTPGGITVTTAGDVVVTGKFKGEATFGTDVLTSAWDPWTMDDGFDVFIASWSTDGTYQWVQQGSGPHDDEGVDIVCDASDMLYVTGQFSDTITFDVQHPNISLNSMFVIKLDPSGNEQWFRKCGGSTYNQVSDLRWSGDDDLLITGDVSQTMYWVDVFPTAITNTEEHAYFILRVDEDGSLLDATTMGSSSAVHAASLTEQADSVVVFGEFECSFTGLQDAYASNGIFMASGLKDLFIAKHTSADLTFVEAQQFGGSGAKTAGGITVVQNELLFSGSFNATLFLPRKNPLWGEPVYGFPGCSFVPTNNWQPYCGDSTYSQVAWAEGQGLADGFLTKGYEENRLPYDWWNRPAVPPCDRSDLSELFCINAGGLQCPDSISGCGSVMLYSVVPFPRPDDFFCMFGTTVGPWSYQWWSNGSSQDQTEANYTDWYYFDVYGTNSCWHWRDSIHVTINPEPDARLSDTSGVFLNSLQPSIWYTCDPMLVWATQTQPTDEVLWVVGADTTWSDTVAVTASGLHRLYVISENGCTYIGTTNFILIDNPPFPNITDVETHFFAQGQIFTGDTLGTCSPFCASGNLINTWYVDGVPTALPNGFRLRYESIYGCGPPSNTINVNSPISWTVEIDGPGWYTIEVEMLLELMYPQCDTTNYPFTFLDSLFILPGQPPQFTVDDVGMCAGDTILIPFECNLCDSVNWTGPGIVWTSATGDSVRVNEMGYYYLTAYHTEYGNTCQSSTNLLVHAPYPPPILIVPADGVICPNDSVLLYTWPPAIDHQWTGPGAIVLPNNDSIWVSEPGDYYLTNTLYPGCVATNGPRTVLNFSSPFIEAFPTGTICANGAVELHVAAGPGSTVEWQPPLSGSALEQTVTSAGTYSCVVTSCGIEWELFYDVVPTQVSADLDTTAYFLCEHTTLVLTAPPGGDIYQWFPAGSGQQLVVDTAGTYQLVVIDAFGCSDTSAMITVVPHIITEPATAMGDTVCLGETATFIGSGSGTLNWYADADTSDLLGSGTPYTFLPSGPDTLYLIQNQDGCPGLPVAAIVAVNAPPGTPVILGDATYCEGDVLLLYADPPPAGELLWITPGGTVVGDSIGPLPATANLSGIYSAMVTGVECAGDTATVLVEVNAAPLAPEVIGNVSLCVGDTLQLIALTNGDEEATWIDPLGVALDDPLFIPDVTANDAGAYISFAMLNGCWGDSTVVMVTVIDCGTGTVTVPNVFTPNGDGTNDVIRLESPGDSPLQLDIYNRWGQLIYTRSAKVVTWDGHLGTTGARVPDGVYYYVVGYDDTVGEHVTLTGYVHVFH